GRAGRTDEAIAVYEQILRRAPNDETVVNNLAYVLAQTRRDKPSLDRALQLASRFTASARPNYIDTLGLVQYRLGLYDQAARQLARAASLAPEDAGVHLHYGMALVRKGDIQQGGEIVRKALASKTPLADHDEAQALLARS
ncbi:MAG: tetratricopeptide repeat protein, partial [Betaproteobacteria bacterium]